MSTPKHNYASFKIDSPVEFETVAALFDSSWVFRGQENSKWDISTSMERDDTRLERGHFADFEAFSIEQIKAYEPHDECQLSPVSDHFSLLALLQHHGCITRLVDFTESIKVALYFAYREAPKKGNDIAEGAIWAIKQEALKTKVAAIINQQVPNADIDAESRNLINRSIEKSLSRQKDECKELAILFGKPAIPNPRMLVQRGLFLAPLNLKYDFKNNLTDGLNLSGNYEPVLRLRYLEDVSAALLTEQVIKILLPKTFRKKVLHYLQEQDITEKMLFPGFDGYIRNLNYETRWMENVL